MKWIVSSLDGYWNNELGWVEVIELATYFNSKEYSLPIGKNVKWEVVN